MRAADFIESLRHKVAGALIWLAHRIYPPKVTEIAIHAPADPVAAAYALTDYEAKMRAMRQATHWN